MVAIEKKTIKVGIAGTGYIANTHLEALRSLKNIEVVGCCDTQLNRAEEFGRRWGIPLTSNSITELIEKCQLDAIHILTPPDSHYELTKKIINSGINVFLEKPMGISSSECLELVQLAKKNNVKIGINHNSLYHPAFLLALDSIHKNRIGKVSRVAIHQMLPLRQIEAGKFAFWMFNDPKNIIFEQAPHPIAQVRKLLGEIIEVKAMAYEKKEISLGIFFYTYWQIMLKCEQGYAQIELSFSNKSFPQNMVMVTGQDGAITIDLFRNIFFIQDKTIAPDYLEGLINGLRHLSCPLQAGQNFMRYALAKMKLVERPDAFYSSIKTSIQSFYDALIKEECLPVSGEDGVKIVEVCERIVEGAKLIKNNPKKIESRLNDNLKPKVLITGANGFIGADLVQAFINQGIPVRALVRNSRGLKQHLFSPLVEIIVGDITDKNSLKGAVEEIEYVYHLAHGGNDSWNSFNDSNVLATQQFAEICLDVKVKYFIYTSTIATYYYGKFPKSSFINEKSPIDNKPEARPFYARSKILAEQLVLNMYKEKGLPLVMFRPGIVVGEGGLLYHSGVGQWLRDNVCDYWGMGKNELPFVLVEDVVAALGQVLKKEHLEGEIFNLAGDVCLSARDYIKYLKQYSGRNIKASAYPIPLLFLSEAFKYTIKKIFIKDKNALLSYRDLYTRMIPVKFDCSKAKTLLSWKPCNDKAVFIEKAIRWAFK